MISQPIKFLFESLDSTATVPDPEKRSPTISFSFVNSFINAFGITVFLMPVKLYDSGISGTSMLLSQITPSQLSLSLFLLILNIPLFIFGFKKQGKLFTVYSLYTVIMYSLGAWL